MISSSKPISVAVFASGRGSNLEAILTNIGQGKLDARIMVVISNLSSAGALEIARQHKIPAIHLSQKQFPTEAEFTETMLTTLKSFQIELIVLAGYLKKMPIKIIQTYKHRIINIHPALLPSFGGAGLYGHYVHEAVLSYGCKVSGATVHLVDEEYDSGAPILQKCVPVLSDDTPEILAARVLQVEHEILPRAIQLFAEHRIIVQNRQVRINESKSNNTSAT